jgi:preprotein translocase subunit SecY
MMSKDLINKILITLGFIFLYRLLAYVPVPGVNIDVVKEFFDSNANNALGLVNMFSGKAVERLSIISLGIMPYITASIIMELLAATFPALGKMKKRARWYAKIYANYQIYNYCYYTNSIYWCFCWS